MLNLFLSHINIGGVCVREFSGGTLKALTPSDKESLQARWCDLDTIKSSLDLR